MAGVIQPKNKGQVSDDPNQELVPLEARVTRGSLTMAWKAVAHIPLHQEWPIKLQTIR